MSITLKPTAEPIGFVTHYQSTSDVAKVLTQGAFDSDIEKASKELEAIDDQHGEVARAHSSDPTKPAPDQTGLAGDAGNFEIDKQWNI